MDKRQQLLLLEKVIGINAWMAEKELDLFDPTPDNCVYQGLVVP